MDTRGYVNSGKGNGRRLVIAQPRSGSTLLMRLANACWTRPCGDRRVEFYEHLLGVLKASREGGQFGCDLEKEFCDEYRQSKNQEQHDRGFYWLFNQAIFDNGCAQLHKTTVLGFGNDLMQDFVDEFREANHGQRTHIIFLTRNHDNIIKSFQTREGPGQEGAINHPDLVKGMLAEQLEQMEVCRELEDHWITYEELIEKPFETVVKKLLPYNPIEEKVMAVMENVLR